MQNGRCPTLIIYIVQMNASIALFIIISIILAKVSKIYTIFFKYYTNFWYGKRFCKINLEKLLAEQNIAPGNN